MSATLERTCPTDDELARAITVEDALVASHVAACATCTRAWNEATQTIELARRVRVVLPDRDRREEMRTAILASLDTIADTSERRTEPKRTRWYIAGGALAAAAGIALVLATRDAPTHAHGTITAHAGARYTTTRAPDEVITLHDGTIDVSVAPLHAGERFRVVTADTEIEVRGTAFRVVAELGHVVRVEVAHGHVDVRPHDGGIVSLRTGQSWKSPVQSAARSARTGSSSLEPMEPAREPTAPALEPTAPIQPALAPSTSIEPDLALAPNAPTRAKRDDAHATLDDVRKNRDRAKPDDATTRDDIRVKLDDATTRDDARAPTTPSISVSRPAPTAQPTRPLDALAYDEGWAAMRGGDFEHAASAFARVTILEPDGALSEDASYWYAVALARAKRGEAIAAFRDLISRYPHSTHVGEANAMLGWLLVEAKQSAEAERRFRAAIDDPKPSVRDSARSGLAALRR
jgi:TolA-binding protein